MADHFYSVTAAGQSFERKLANLTVGTSAASSNPLELRVTDTAVTKEQLYAFLEWLADEVASSAYVFTQNTPFTG